MGRAGWMAVVITMAVGTTTVAQQPAGLPSVLDRYVTDVVRLGSPERERLLAGHPVTRLVRTRIGPISDRQLRPGAYRELTDDEVRRLAAATAVRRPRRPARPNRSGPSR